MSKKYVSVIVPSYNSQATIEDCLLSVLGTRYPQLEIIVVDDGSQDSSPRLVQEMGKRCPRDIRFIQNEKNAGPAAARNRGARAARGDYLFFLDSDTAMFPDTLERFVCSMADADAVTGVYHYRPLNPGVVPRYKALLNNYFFSRKGVIDYEVFDASRAGIKKEVFEEVGGFDEKLGRGMDYENEEFGYRLIKKHRNLLVPDVQVRHHFPYFFQLTREYFFRVAFWVEIFLRRKRFESGGVTSPAAGAGAMALLFFFASMPFVFIKCEVIYLSLLFLACYGYGYMGFYRYVLRTDKFFLSWAVLCNMYFTVIIALGALWGAAKRFFGRSRVKEII